MSPHARRILVSLVAIVVVASASLPSGSSAVPARWRSPAGRRVALADYKGANPTGVPASLAQASLSSAANISRRPPIAWSATPRKGGKEYAGGLGFKLPFGTLYSTNITPDKETGIGNYSDQDFLNAVHRGIRRDGARLYPAMPYTSYTYMTDADALAIKAYLFSLPPVRATPPPNTLAFPFNQRWAMAFWSACSIRTRASSRTRRRARNGTAAPISPRRWRIAANATRRAISPSRSTTARNSPAR